MEIPLEKTNHLEDGDLDMFLSCAFIVKNTSLGTLLALRNTLSRMFGENLLHPTFDSQRVYIVHWNDLSEEYKSHLNRKRE